MRVALVDAVADGAVVVERGEHFAHLGQHLVRTLHVEEGLLLAGERGLGQVLGGGRRAHGKARFGVVERQRGVGLAHRRLERGWERRVVHPLADLGAGLGQRGDVVGVQSLQPRIDLVHQRAVGQELAERVRRGGKAARHAHTGGGELADHFAEAGVLAADRLDVGHPQLFKRYDQGGRQVGLRHGKAP
jgi:hypothetical protein